MDVLNMGGCVWAWTATPIITPVILIRMASDKIIAGFDLIAH